MKNGSFVLLAAILTILLNITILFTTDTFIFSFSTQRLCLKGYEYVQFKRMAGFKDKQMEFVVLKSLTDSKVLDKNQMIIVAGETIPENLIACEE